jgi:hypothetical protein
MPSVTRLDNPSRDHRRSSEGSERWILDAYCFRMAWYVLSNARDRVLMVVLIVIGFGLRKVGLARDVRGVNGPKVISGPH